MSLPVAPSAPALPSAVPILESGPADNASIAAELESMTGDQEITEDAPSKKEPAEKDEKPAVEKQAKEIDDDDDDEESPETKEEPADPQLNKRLEAVQRAERRAKEAVAREREVLTADRQEMERKFAPLAAQVERFEQLAKRAKFDPVSVLLHLGLSEDDFEPIARSIYDHSKAAASDPKRKEYSQRAMREREAADQLSQVQKEFSEFKQQMETREREATSQQQVATYLDAVAKAASDETPIVRSMIEKNPSRARERLTSAAQYLLDETGEVPDAGDVLRALEKAEREELESRGIDPDMVSRKPVAATEKKPSKTLSADLSSPTKPKVKDAPKSKREERDDLVRDLERMDAQ